jgi:hypothetical protein
MPFSVKLNLGAKHPVIFEGWIKSAFDQYVPKGTPFAKASSPNGPGLIVTNGPVIISAQEPLKAGTIIRPDAVIAYGFADGDEIPYGKPYCTFVQTANADH